MSKGEMAAILDFAQAETALLPLTAARPVGLLPFAGRYRLIDFPLSAISNADIHSVALFLPESARSVQDHVRSGATWNLDQLQGGVFMFANMAVRDYADPLLRARYYDDYIQFLRLSQAPYTVIMGASNVANIDLNAVLAYHKAGDAPLTVVYKNLPRAAIAPDDPTLVLSELGTASSVLYASERHDPANTAVLPAFMTVAVSDTVTLINLLEEAAAASEFKPLPVILQEAVLANNANAFEYTGYLARITSLARYYEANLAMLNESVYQALLFSSIPILTKSKNEVPTFYGNQAAVTNSLIGTGAYLEGTATDSVLFRNVVIHQDATVQDSIIMQGSKVSTGSTVRYAILDKGVVVGPNLTLEGTPTAPLVIGKNQTVFASLRPKEAAHD